MREYRINRAFTYEGKRYYIHADTEDEYFRKREQKIKDLKSHYSDKGITLNEWALDCVDTYKPNLAEITKKKYVQRMKHCILEPIGWKPLTKITPEDCQSVLNEQKGKSKTQINEVYNQLRFVMRMARVNRLIEYDPTEFLIKPKGEQTHRRALTPEEREAIIKVASTDRKWYCYLLMLYCGCRPSEAYECKGEDITLIDNVHVLHVRGRKSANAERFIPIPEELYVLIKNTPYEEYIALTREGNKITNPQRTWQGFKYYLNIEMGTEVYRNHLIPPYKVADDLVPYCLRHEYCTELARRGVDIRVAQRLMGHSDISLTANIYTNLDNIKTAKLYQNTLEGATQGATPNPTQSPQKPIFDDSR